MTKSETRFRNWAIKEFPGAFIKKLPDFKSTGISSARGLPDYMVVFNNRTLWFEVKTIPCKSISLYHFTKYQLQVFKKMSDNGAHLKVWVEGNIIDFKDLILERTIKMID